MYRRIPWEMVADPLGSTGHTLGTPALKYKKNQRNLMTGTKTVLPTKQNGEYSVILVARHVTWWELSQSAPVTLSLFVT